MMLPSLPYNYPSDSFSKPCPPHEFLLICFGTLMNATESKIGEPLVRCEIWLAHLILPMVSNKNQFDFLLVD